MKLPPLTPKQQEILRLLYRHRFLGRKHVQSFVGHKDKRRSARWLKELREKQYIGWRHDAENPAAVSTPATYFLNLNGIRWLRQYGYPGEELRKRYKDRAREQDFIARCLLLADCTLHLEARNKNTADPAHYEYAIGSDYRDPDNDYYFLAENEYIQPSLVFTKAEEVGSKTTHQTYLLELFDLATPRYAVKKAIKSYVEYLQSDEWERAERDEEPPVILFACPTLREMIYAKRFARKQLNEVYDEAIPDEIKLRCSTLEKLKAKGVTAVIWEHI